jgi:hypothetical protein
LLIDDGVPDRANRHAILNDDYCFAGIGFSQHPIFETVCVIVLATLFTDGESDDVVNAPEGAPPMYPEADSWVPGAIAMSTEVHTHISAEGESSKTFKKWTMPDGTVKYTTTK